MKFSVYDESGRMKPEVKIAMVIDDYKLNNKDEWWRKCLVQIPEIERYYVFDREEIGPGVTTNTCTIFRYYRLVAK